MVLLSVFLFDCWLTKSDLSSVSTCANLWFDFVVVVVDYD